MGGTVGIILTSLNDEPLLDKMYQSLMGSLTQPYGLLCIDGGSTDRSVEIMSQFCTVIGPHNCEKEFSYLGRKPESFRHLSVALNIGIELCMTKQPEYIAWIHPDMEFPQVGWLDKLIEYMETHPEVGKVEPNLVGQPDEERTGNQCPTLIPTKILLLLKQQDGYYFDERYRYIGGYEDWDINKRIIDLGYQVKITPVSKVKHDGEGTRRHTGIGEYYACRDNADVFFSKWKQWNAFV